MPEIVGILKAETLPDVLKYLYNEAYGDYANVVRGINNGQILVVDENDQPQNIHLTLEA